MNIDLEAASAEVKAMAVVDGALRDLESGEQERVLKWAWARYCPDAKPQAKEHTKTKEPESRHNGQDTQSGSAVTFETLAEFMAAANPKTDVQRALVAGQWLQEKEGHGQLSGQAINKELKHLGHGVKNITSALSSLMDEKPQLVVQLKKSGSTKQARKQYKVTEAGKAAVQRMLQTPEG
jgi:hypothetical protein